MKEPISRRMLSYTLRRMEREGLIVRDVADGSAARVDYSLTPRGSRLTGEMARVVWEHEDLILAAREVFDARERDSIF